MAWRSRDDASQGRKGCQRANLGRERRNITKGQKAMGYAMRFPVAPTAQE
jgi:hypothetical protein